ncbi:MAG TPA: hypothetical protein VHX86_08395 [Tepidisphaeraceae bacterium]|nr:hypothetical protein [Tepidisphaeraceae bacterium]
MRAITRILLAAMVLALGTKTASAAAEQTAGIRQVQLMPDLPSPCIIRDWRQVAASQDQLLFNLHAPGQYMPVLRFVRDDRGKVIGFGLPDYVGDIRRPADGSGNGVVDLGAVWGATLVGIDKSLGSYDYVKMCRAYFDARPKYRMIGNGIGHADPGETFWYTLFPNIVFACIAQRYPGETAISGMAFQSAVSWTRAVAALADPAKDDAADFDHTGFDFKTMRGVDNGKWKEPDAGAGVAWIEYAAYSRWHDPAFLVAADRCMRYLDQRPAELDPWYEVLMPFGALAAVRMNAELGRHYDTDKMINWCFDRSAARPDWKVNTDRWDDADTAGLVGGTDGPPRFPGVGGYGFAMNTFCWPWPLAPIARYDPRYAHDIGKWMLNVASAARLYYANAHPRDGQTCPDWNGDPEHVIAYEGLKFRWDDPNQPLLATGDAIHEHWGPKTDFGLYGSVFVGVYGAIIAPTDDPQILRLDLLATDSCHPQAYPSYLYYNPHTVERTITLDVGAAPRDIYDAVSGRFLTHNATGRTPLKIGSGGALVVVLTPAGGTLTRDGGKTFVNGVVIDYRRGSNGQ